MAKLFRIKKRIKKKGLRYIVSSIVLLLIIGAVLGAMFGIGYMLDKLGIDWWDSLAHYPEKNITSTFTTGLMTCVALLFLFILGILIVLAVEEIAEKWFNSVRKGNSDSSKIEKIVEDFKRGRKLKQPEEEDFIKEKNKRR